MSSCRTVELMLRYNELKPGDLVINGDEQAESHVTWLVLSTDSDSFTYMWFGSYPLGQIVTCPKNDIVTDCECLSRLSCP